MNATWSVYTNALPESAEIIAARRGLDVFALRSDHPRHVGPTQVVCPTKDAADRMHLALKGLGYTASDIVPAPPFEGA